MFVNIHKKDRPTLVNSDFVVGIREEYGTGSEEKGIFLVMSTWPDAGAETPELVRTSLSWMQIHRLFGVKAAK